MYIKTRMQIISRFYHVEVFKGKHITYGEISCYQPDNHRSRQNKSKRIATKVTVDLDTKKSYNG